MCMYQFSVVFHSGPASFHLENKHEKLLIKIDTLANIIQAPI